MSAPLVAVLTVYPPASVNPARSISRNEVSGEAARMYFAILKVYHALE
jgi:hypothetical protein